MEKRKQFTFYRSFLEGMEHFPREEWLGYLLAVIHYALDRTVDDDLTETQKGMFVFIKPHLDTAWEKALIGSKGGAVRKASKLVSEKENENENEKENEIETETKGEGFSRFWERYPLKLGRDEAAAQWVCVREKHREQRILDGLDRWIHSRMWGLEQGRYIPKAEKWLREEWFLQKPGEDVPQGASGHLGKAEIEAIQRMFAEQ